MRERINETARAAGFYADEVRALAREATGPTRDALNRAGRRLDAADEMLTALYLATPAEAPAPEYTMSVEQFDPADTLAKLGADVRRWRTLLAMTLDDLAWASGVSKSYLSLIETARLPAPPQDDKLSMIERALELPAGSLVTRGDLLRSPASVRRLIAQLVAGRQAAAGKAIAA